MRISQLTNPPRRRLALLMFGVLASGYIGAMLSQPPGVYDEGLIVSGAERVLNGQYPYLDFNSGYPPGQFYTIAMVFRVFGSSLMAARVWDSLWRLAIVAAVIWLARELGGEKINPAPLVCCAALAGSLGFRLYPMMSATLPCVCALCCALAFARTQNRRWIFGAGLLLGCTALYRHDLAACAGTAVLAGVLRDRRAIVWLAAGFLLVAGPAAACLATVIPHSVLRQAFLDFPGANAAARHLPLLAGRAPVSFLRDLCLPVAILVFAALDACRAPAARRAPLVILAAAAGLMFILATQRLDTVHAFPSLMVCLVILAACRLPTLPRRALISGTVLFYGVLPLLEWNFALQAIRTIPASGIARADPVRISPSQAQAVRYIQDRLPPGEKLYVGTATHSRIYINDALFRFLANRPPATRYDMWVPGMTDSAPVQSEIVKELESNAVRYVVLYDAPGRNEPNLSSVDSGVRIIDDYLNRRYRKVAVFGVYSILQRVA